jgi:hypothetical protein
VARCLAREVRRQLKQGATVTLSLAVVANGHPAKEGLGWMQVHADDANDLLVGNKDEWMVTPAMLVGVIAIVGLTEPPAIEKGRRVGWRDRPRSPPRTEEPGARSWVTLPCPVSRLAWNLRSAKPPHADPASAPDDSTEAGRLT